ncbi:MAG: hypothetical protein WDO17_24540 [Alphaproteobacteria bacterium]
MLLAAPAAASDGKQAAARALAAAQALKQQAVETAAAGKQLDFTSGPAAEHLRRIFDSKALAELPPAAASDMAWMTDWMGAVSTTNHTLYEFGADMKRTPQLDPAVLARNVREYEDQMTVGMVFQQRLFSRALDSAYQFLESLAENERTPVRLAGLKGMVDGYLETIKGALCFASDNTIKPANARMIAAAARESVDEWIELTEDDTRKQFISLLTAGQQQTKDKETAEHFRAIQVALEAAKS